MPLRSDSDVSDIESVSDDEGNQVPPANDGTYSDTADGTPIDETGEVIVLDTRGKTTLDLHLSGTEAASYALEAGPDGSDWRGPFKTWDSTTTITATFETGSRYVRVRITESATAGSTADAYMEAS